MSKKVFDQIAEGLQEALAVARGEPAPNEIIGIGKPLPRLAAVAIVDNRRVSVAWRDGSSATVDLAPVLNSHRHFIPIRDNDDLFATIRVNEDGNAIEWDGGIELSAVWAKRLSK